MVNHNGKELVQLSPKTNYSVLPLLWLVFLPSQKPIICFVHCRGKYANVLKKSHYDYF